MALILTSQLAPTIAVENAYHCIVGTTLNYQHGSATCVVQSYKNATIRQTYKTVLAELNTLKSEHEVLHAALGDAQAAQDQTAMQQARFALMSKEVELSTKSAEFENAQPFGTLELKGLDVSGFTDVTRSDLYAAIKAVPEWSIAEDA
ncbi:MAG: hypothetical protein ACNI26_15170 [Terasakiella sp.]|uniref:hypothetical protein n=1 Tax=unclassified Terasakiella TaxID=2614952 RepID=UPI003AFFB16D